MNATIDVKASLPAAGGVVGGIGIGTGNSGIGIGTGSTTSSGTRPGPMDTTGIADDEGPAKSPPAPQSSSSSRRSRIALACQRCKRRKQRCDGAHPVCTSCFKAKSQCTYERPVRPTYPGGKSLYIKALEERIAFLEAHMPEYGEDHLEDAPTRFRQAERLGRPGPAAQSPYHADSPSEEEHSSLVDGVAYLSLCASGTTDTTPEPFYIGSSSGATIARMIPLSIFRPTKSKSRTSPAAAAAAASAATDASSPVSPQEQVGVLRPGLPNDRLPRAAPFGQFPPRAVAQRLFTVFFDRLHTRWPILDRKLYVSTVFEQQYSQGVLPLVQASILHLIYAISAGFLHLTKRSCDVDAESHFAAAIVPMDYILEQHNLATEQFLVLLAIYGKRLPYGAGSWSQVRYGVTLAVELGLHRKRAERRPPAPGDAKDLEIRRRVFWSVYCLDRETSLLLGRSFAISDRDINCELPTDSPEFWELTSSGPPPSPPAEGESDPMPGWSNVRPFIHIIKLRQLQSKIHRTVFRVDKEVLNGVSAAERERLDNKIAAVRKELDEWARTIPVPPSTATCVTWMYEPEGAYHGGQDASIEYFNLQYHKTVLTLFTALVPTLPPTDPRFIAAARSAARVCNAYKRLNQQKTLSYTIVALHSCFIAGLTLVYCLWRNTALFSYDALEATRACSLCLTIFGEKWPGAVKYRDIFDALSGSLLRAVVGGGGNGGGGGGGTSSRRHSRVDPSVASTAADRHHQQRQQQPQQQQQQQQQQAPTHNVFAQQSAPPKIDPTHASQPSPQPPLASTGGPLAFGDASGLLEMVDKGIVGEWERPAGTEPDLGHEPGGGYATDAGNAIMDAVREAFMEVDEVAASGWQGWRMFSEVVQSDLMHQNPAAMNNGGVMGARSSSSMGPPPPPHHNLVTATPSSTANSGPAPVPEGMDWAEYDSGSGYYSSAPVGSSSSVGAQAGQAQVASGHGTGVAGWDDLGGTYESF